MLGKQVTVISYSGCNARILGYDSSQGLSDLVLIVTAIVKVCSEKGQFIIWKIHQAPYIQESDTCLLSEYQMRSKGTCVDSCSIHHEVRPGVRGTQCIWSHGPQQSLKVNLTDLGGTMGVKMYPVLPGDMLKYPVHEITSSLEWQPKRHQDCDEPPPKRPCNREIAQEFINNTFLLKL